MFVIADSYFQESDYISLPWASIVFHCPVSGNPRIFCAQFLSQAIPTPVDDDNNSNNNSKSGYSATTNGLIAVVVICFILILVLIAIAAGFLKLTSVPSSNKAMANNENL